MLANPIVLGAVLKGVGIDLLIVCGHAPIEKNVKALQLLWPITKAFIAKRRHHRDVALFIYANAGVGSIQSEVIGPHQAEKGTFSGGLFHEDPLEHKILLPTTFEHHHRGTGHTWTHSGGKRFRKDYIGLAGKLASLELTSQVRGDTGITTAKEDHDPSALNLRGLIMTEVPTPTEAIQIRKIDIKDLRDQDKMAAFCDDLDKVTAPTLGDRSQFASPNFGHSSSTNHCQTFSKSGQDRGKTSVIQDNGGLTPNQDAT